MSTLIKYIGLVFSCIFLTGCWSANELTEFSLATALAIDKDEQGYMVTIQVINPTEIAGDTISDRSTITSYSAVGDTMFDAIRKLTEISPRKVNLSHLQLIVYGEDLARDGIGKTLDFLVRDHELRTDFALVIAQNVTGKDLVGILTPLEKIPATKIKGSLTSAQDFLASMKLVQLHELVSSISAQGQEAVLNGIYVEGDVNYGFSIENTQRGTPPASLHLNGIAVFHDDKLQGWLNTEEGKGYNYIVDNIRNTTISTSCMESGKLALEVTDSKTTLKSKWKDGRPGITINIDIEANIASAECAIDLNKASTLEMIKKEAEDSVKNSAESSIQTAQEHKSDIFGFGESLKRSHPKQWNKIKDNWPSYFSNITTDVNVSLEIKNAGSIAQPIYDAIEKKQQQEENE